jgi:signal transduction histidine kinase
MRTQLRRLTEQFGFGSPPETVPSSTRSPTRAVASGVISATGLALLVPNLFPFLDGGGPVALVLGAAGTVVSVGLIAVGGLLYISDFSDRNTVRIAAWNLLGVVVLGGVMLGHAVAQNRLSGGIAPSLFTVGNLLAIGAAAHVIIGVYDARRVRAEQLARERRRTAVLNRVLRHNLRNEAQVLRGHADIVASRPGDVQLRRSATVLQESAETVGNLAGLAKTITRERDRGPEEYWPRDPASVLDAAVTQAMDSHDGEQDIAVDAPDDIGATVRASDGLETALAELVGNAVEHGEPPVTASVRVLPDAVEFSVADAGAGVPDHERAVITDEAEITQLTHGSGLGLWVVRTVGDAHGGSLSFAEESAEVTLSLPRAA